MNSVFYTLIYDVIHAGFKAPLSRILKPFSGIFSKSGGYPPPESRLKSMFWGILSLSHSENMTDMTNVFAAGENALRASLLQVEKIKFVEHKICNNMDRT